MYVTDQQQQSSQHNLRHYVSTVFIQKLKVENAEFQDSRKTLFKVFWEVKSLKIELNKSLIIIKERQITRCYILL